MQKEFNITGICLPDFHYMMDSSQKVAEVMALIKQGKYFTINRPRQYGKTTILHLIAQELIHRQEAYLVIDTSFEGLGKTVFEEEKRFCQYFCSVLVDNLDYVDKKLSFDIHEKTDTVYTLNDLSKLITYLVKKSNKKIILLIDEVDRSSNYLLFLDFLGMLRTKYLRRVKPMEATFHSVVLAGVHDVKSLKLKMEGAEAGKYNSPWNIATDFNVRMRFQPSEIAPMLEEYAKDTKVKMKAADIAAQLYYYTSGYPFLVSKLCKILAEDSSFSKKKIWTSAMVEEAVQILLKENNTNFDSLIKNLENNAALYQLVYRLIIDGESIPFNPQEPVINSGRLYGIFKKNGTLKIHNRIYEQYIYEYMTVKTMVNLSKGENYAGHFLLKKNQLNIEGVLEKFQQFMKEQHSKKQKNFIEEEGRLVFLSFLAPILNGHGYSFKEVQVSLEKRLDIIITFFQHRYIIELKRWYGSKAHQKGLDQLADYLEIHHLRKGYLLIFDNQKQKKWQMERISHKGKDIFAVWV